MRIVNRLFGTEPVAVHCPGPPHDGWHRFSGTVLASARKTATSGSDLTIITWNSGPRPKKPCGVLEKSLERLGLSAMVLGQDTPNWQNIFKFRLTAEALKSVTTPYVLGADSSDAVLIDDPAILVDQFRRHFTCDLVFSATGSRCWPELPEFVRFESSLPMAAVAQNRHWLNSGLWIGKTEFCRHYFECLAKEPPVDGYGWSDQAVIKRVWPAWYPRVQLDYLAQLFQWFNEDLAVMRIERPLVDRQRQLVRVLRPLGHSLVGAEVGVFDGHTSDALLRELPGLKLWMVDPWAPYEGRSIVGVLDQPCFDRAYQSAMWWTTHAADRRFVLRQPSPGAADSFADDSLDFAFIDGNHLYKFVRDDIYAWWPKVKSDGLLAGHDYGIYRDAEGIWGVRRAVDEFASAVGREVHVGADGVWWIGK